eukprot:TRINITY_DN8268_c0_g1_i2.p1 TRINITY_DN8268_c0_g1~~TRINITY_DN8268_c0_g1_i2.p1  ORF type:complete len:115 (+),score=12.36 TRINITY_DN8268_c0_g1_i2:237-581(+)
MYSSKVFKFISSAVLRTFRNSSRSDIYLFSNSRICLDFSFQVFDLTDNISALARLVAQLSHDSRAAERAVKALLSDLISFPRSFKTKGRIHGEEGRNTSKPSIKTDISCCTSGE